LFKSDDEFDYVKIIADNDLQTDCKSQQLPGNCRLVKISKPGAGFNQWTESQDANEVGGLMERIHSGSPMKMKLHWGSCPAEFKKISVNATWAS